MVSTPAARQAGQARKRPEERRAEIVAEAARIALEDGLERITLRAVATGLGVRPGLISHYFPAAEDLVIAAFSRAVETERASILERGAVTRPLDRLALFIDRVERGESIELTRLWLNARHLARFLPALAYAIEEQEGRDRERMVAIIEAGRAEGAFRVEDPFAACVRIFMAVDGLGAYANSPEPFEVDAYAHFVSDISEWTLGLKRGALRTAMDALRAGVVS